MVAVKRERVRMRDADGEFRYSWVGRSEVLRGVVLCVDSGDAILSVEAMEEGYEGYKAAISNGCLVRWVMLCSRNRCVGEKEGRKGRSGRGGDYRHFKWNLEREALNAQAQTLKGLARKSSVEE